MKKYMINYWIDIGMLISFVITFLTGIVKWPGLIFKLGFSYDQLPMGLFTLLHDWAGLVMGVLCFLHVLLHMKWMIKITKRITKGETK